MAKSNHTFRASLDYALAVFSGEKTKTHNEERFMEGTYTGYRLEKSYHFLAEDEVETRFKVKAKDLAKKLPLETLVDESGDKISGFILGDGSMRKVTFFADTFTTYSETLFTPERQLRSSQGQEIATWYRGGLKKTLPKALRSAATTLEGIPAIVEGLELEQKAAEAKAALEVPVEVPKPEPEAPQGVLQQAKAEEEDDSEQDIQYVEVRQPELKQPQQEDPKKKKRGGKSKNAEEAKNGGKSAGSLAGRRLTKKMPPTSAASVVSEAQSAVASSAGGVAKGSDDKSEQAHKKHDVKKMDIAALLRGQSLAIWKHHAKRELSGLQKNAETASTVDTVLLAAHVDLFERAEQILPANVTKISRATRLKIIEDLAAAGFSIPAHCQSTLIALTVGEAEKDWSTILKTMRPTCAPGESFDGLQPALGPSQLTETVKAKLLHKVFLSELLVPLLCGGQKNQASIESLCGGLLREYSDITGAPEEKGK